MTWKTWAAVNLQRYRIEADEWVTVQPGFVMVVDAFAVLIVDGCLRLDGAVKVG